MSDNKKLQENRIKNFHDFYNNRIPDHVPTGYMISHYLVAEYGGQNLFDYQYDYGRLREPALALDKRIISDVTPILPCSQVLNRPAEFYQILGSQSFVMGKNGVVQHPEVVGMQSDEYRALIDDPFTFLMETVIPRQYKNLDPCDGFKTATTIMKAQSSLDKSINASLPWFMEITEQGGHYPGAPAGSSGMTEPPFDFIADQLRSFSGVSMDIRRHRSELKEACEALLPVLFEWGRPPVPNAEGSVFIPLHMPTFMREKDFLDLWLPTFKTMIEQYAALGVRCNIFCEDDWTRYLDVLQDFPAGTQMWFEFGDPQLIKDKLGDKMIIQGLFPVSALRGTKEEVVSKARELLDIMMPGGGYYFHFDKNPFLLNEVNIDNWAALSETVAKYGVYKNAGEACGTPLNAEGFVFDPSKFRPIESKYLTTWEALKAENPLVPEIAKGNLAQLNNELINFFMYLLV